MKPNNKQITQQMIKSNDLREMFFAKFREFALSRGKLDFLDSWIDEHNAMYNDRWRRKYNDTTDICIFFCVTKEACRSEIMFFNNSKDRNFDSYRTNLLNMIKTNEENYKKHYDEITYKGLEDIENESTKKYLMLDKTKDSQYRIGFYIRIGFGLSDKSQWDVAFRYLLDTYKILDGLFK